MLSSDKQWSNWPGSTRACCTIAGSEEPATVAGPKSVPTAVPIAESLRGDGGRECLRGLTVWKCPYQTWESEEMEKDMQEHYELASRENFI